MKLYHFTCSHSVGGINAEGALRPHTQPQLDGRSLIWLTDLDAPDRLDIGLTSTILRCDRMEFRATVDVEVPRWLDYLRTLPREVRMRARALTDGAGLPMHWYVSERQLPVVSLERWL